MMAATTAYNAMLLAIRHHLGARGLALAEYLVAARYLCAEALLRSQPFDAWGAVRTGGIGQTTLNLTGQRLDGTEVLSYNAR